MKTEIPADPAEFIVWTFNSYDSSGSTSLQLGVHFENLNSGLTMTVYCPFWMLNKTGLTLSYRVREKVFNAIIMPFMMIYYYCLKGKIIFRSCKLLCDFVSYLMLKVYFLVHMLYNLSFIHMSHLHRKIFSHERFFKLAPKSHFKYFIAIIYFFLSLLLSLSFLLPQTTTATISEIAKN